MCKKMDTLCKNRYISGAKSSFKVLFVGNSYSDAIVYAPDTLSDRQIAVAKESAKNALANPLAVTPSAFK